MPESRVAVFLGVDIAITILALSVVTLRLGYRWSTSKLATSDYLIGTAMVGCVFRGKVGVYWTDDAVIADIRDTHDSGHYQYAKTHRLHTSPGLAKLTCSSHGSIWLWPSSK
jgi:hypothetical protein